MNPISPAALQNKLLEEADTYIDKINAKLRVAKPNNGVYEIIIELPDYLRDEIISRFKRAGWTSITSRYEAGDRPYDSGYTLWKFR